jgi:hypothetical protein
MRDRMTNAAAMMRERRARAGLRAGRSSLERASRAAEGATPFGSAEAQGAPPEREMTPAEAVAHAAAKAAETFEPGPVQIDSEWLHGDQ